MRKISEALLDGGGLGYDMSSLESMGCHMFFGEVDVDTSHAACDFILKSNLTSQGEIMPLTMFVNSVGGDCTEGFAVIDLMETSRLPIATVGIGAVMSMGVLLVSAGYKGLRTMTKNTEVMAHQFAGQTYGKMHELVAAHESNLMLERRFIRHFLNHTTMTEKQIRDILFAPSDRYLTPAECKKFGLIDQVVDYFDQPPVIEAPAKKPAAKKRKSPSSAK
jgi:ATP-dependent Clp protease protease subunit